MKSCVTLADQKILSLILFSGGKNNYCYPLEHAKVTTC